MGSHMRRIEASEPPWLLNQSVKLMLSRALTLRMPPSGSNRALTTGEVPSARELAACRWGTRFQLRTVTKTVTPPAIVQAAHTTKEVQGARGFL